MFLLKSPLAILQSVTVCISSELYIPYGATVAATSNKLLKLLEKAITIKQLAEHELFK